MTRLNFYSPLPPSVGFICEPQSEQIISSKKVQLTNKVEEQLLMADLKVLYIYKCMTFDGSQG